MKYIIYITIRVGKKDPPSPINSSLIGVDAGPEKSKYDDKETFLPRDFSLFTSVILFCILNIRSGQNGNMVQN